MAAASSSNLGAGAGPSSPAIAQARRWYWQRISAMVLAVCVIVHLAVIVYAVRGGLSGAEILGRTRGNWAFAAFYATFVIASAAHVPIGVANIAREWAGLGERAALWLGRALALVLLLTGLRAVVAVT
ncbi:MAG: succinate dehydrogenase [Pseudomonadota bacterium]|nr:succinate dehydrogenase [Pseudomonadota bacterium]